MKEKYFFSCDIGLTAGELAEEVEEYRKRHPFNLTPAVSALLIIDMQKYFLREESHAFVPSAPSIVSRLRKLVNIFVGAKLPVVLTRHLNNLANVGSMEAWWKEMISRDDRTSELIEEIIVPEAKVVEKTQYDAFYKTELEKFFVSRGVKQLIIGGLLTHLCCETTARSAFVRGFEVLFVVDGTASYNKDFHRASLLNLSHGFAVPVLVEEIVRVFGE